MADLFPGAGLAPGLGWMTKFGVVEATPVIASYVERIGSRPAVVRARERDAALAARQMPA